MVEFSVQTGGQTDFVDATGQIQQAVTDLGISEGVVLVFVPHTTAAVTINEKADPAVASDISRTLEKIVPEGAGYSHAEGNSDSHVKSSLVGASELVMISGAVPVLGTWQAVFFCEFDGPRSRRCLVRIAGE